MTAGELPGPAPDEREQPAGRRTADGVRIEAGQQTDQQPQRTVLSALVSHDPGVLATVAGLFSRRQFNIESLTVGETADPGLARMTIVVVEPEPGVEQARRQLQKRPQVHSVQELDTAVQRELALVTVEATAPEDIKAITDMYDSRTLDVTPETITVELTGDEQTIDAAIDAYRQFGVREIARTGYAALARGDEPTAPGSVAASEQPTEEVHTDENQYTATDDQQTNTTTGESTDEQPTNTATDEQPAMPTETNAEATRTEQ